MPDVAVLEDRRRQPDRRRQSRPYSAHYVCPFCPLQGDEQTMIDHALDRGHIMRMDSGSLGGEC